VEIQTAEILLDFLVVLVDRDGSLEPLRQASDGLLAAFGADCSSLDLVGLGGRQRGVGAHEIGKGRAGIESVAEGGARPVRLRGRRGCWRVV